MARITRTVLDGNFDLIHSHGRLAYLLPLLPLRIPKIMTYGRHISPRSVKWGGRLSGKSLAFTGVSSQLIQDVAALHQCHVVYNGVDDELLEYQPHTAADSPLVFLGRLEWIKGPHLAIDVARRSGRRLILAGNIPEDLAHPSYFESEIQPHLDGKQISYIGPVNDLEKNRLLGQASAFLMPILWDEPFGLVMAEALACGTPVISLRRGAAPEIIEHGVTGFLCNTVEEMAAAVARIPGIDRAACRRSLEERFSGATMVREYLRVYDLTMSNGGVVH